MLIRTQVEEKQQNSHNFFVLIFLVNWDENSFHFDSSKKNFFPQLFFMFCSLNYSKLNKENFYLCNKNKKKEKETISLLIISI